MGDFLTRTCRKGILEAEGFPIAKVSDYLEQPDTVVWVDVCTPNKEELHGLPSGVITSTALIGILSFGLYVLIRKREWL
jgi:hypothetical protein